MANWANVAQSATSPRCGLYYARANLAVFNFERGRSVRARQLFGEVLSLEKESGGIAPETRDRVRYYLRLIRDLERGR